MAVQTVLFALGALVVVWLAFKLAKFAFRFLKYILLLALAGFLVWYFLFRPQGAPALQNLNWRTLVKGTNVLDCADNGASRSRRGAEWGAQATRPVGNTDVSHKRLYHLNLELF